MGGPLLGWLARILRSARATLEDRGDMRADDYPRRARDEEEELDDMEDEEEEEM